MAAVTVPDPATEAGAPGDRSPDATRVAAGALLRRAADLGVARAGPHLVINEPLAGERVVALHGPCTVGRGGGAGLRLADPSASRLHLRLQVDEAGIQVEDLHSRNGLRVNGQRARGRWRLRSGDRLEVGETLLHFVDPLAPAAPAGSRPMAGVRRGSRAARLALVAGFLALASLLAALAALPADGHRAGSPDGAPFRGALAPADPRPAAGRASPGPAAGSPGSPR